MTEKYAVLYAYNMWAWLALTGDYNKLRYFNNRRHLLQEQYDCSLCEYDSQINKDRENLCNACPLLNKWPSTTGLFMYCIDNTTAFELWSHRDNVEEKRLYAGDIANALWKRYKELGG